MAGVSISEAGSYIKLSDSMVCKTGDYEVVAGRVSLKSAEDYLKRPDQPFNVFIAERVFSNQERRGAPLIESGLLLDPDKIAKYESHRIQSLDVVLFPEGSFFSKSVLERAYEGLIQKRLEERQTAQEKAEKIRQNVLEVYSRLKELYDSLRGVRLSDRSQIDRRVAGTVAILNGAISSLHGSVYRAVEDLLDGEGRIIASLKGINPPDDEEAALALKIAVGSMLSGFHLSRLRSDIISDASDFTELFLEGLLANSSMWGGMPERGHEERSAGIVRLLREHGCRIPDGLEEVVLAHSSNGLTRRYAYCVSMNFESMHTDETGNIAGTNIYVQRDVLVPEEEVLTEHAGPINFYAGFFSLTNADLRNPSVQARLLDDRLLVKILIVSLVEEFCFMEKSGMKKHLIMEKIAEKIPAPGSESYDLARDYGRNQTMYVLAIAGIAGAFDILFRGALVEFNDDAVLSRATRRQVGLDGCIGAVIDVESGFGPFVYIFMNKNKGGVWLEKPAGKSAKDLMSMRISTEGSLHQLFVPLGQKIKESVFRGSRRRIVGVVDQSTFEARFGHLHSVVPKLCGVLRS